MKLEKFSELLGWTTTDADLVSAVKSYGVSVEDLSKSELSETGQDFLFLKAEGLELSFSPRARFTVTRGEPKGSGPVVLTGMFYRPTGSDDVDPYQGPAPFAKESIQSREDALRLYGKPEKTEEDDGEIDWDQWKFEGFQVRVYYRGPEIHSISVSVPMLKK